MISLLEKSNRTIHFFCPLINQETEIVLLLHMKNFFYSVIRCRITLLVNLEVSSWWQACCATLHPKMTLIELLSSFHTSMMMIQSKLFHRSSVDGMGSSKIWFILVIKVSCPKVVSFPPSFGIHNPWQSEWYASSKQDLLSNCGS